MPQNVERPKFAEGEILSANRLNVAVDYGRGRSARHNRYAHTPGVLHGLELTASGTPLVVTCAPGVAIDGNGREVVLRETKRLDVGSFQGANVEQKTEAGAEPLWYPILLQGQDTTGPVQSRYLDPCGGSASSAVFEGADVVFGRPGLGTIASERPLPDVGVGPGNPNEGEPWPIVLGFVQWDSEGGGEFLKVSDRAPDASYGRQYAGVRADEVEARGGRVTIRTRAPDTQGAPMMTIEQTEDDGVLSFGRDNGKGGMNAVLRVNSKGDLTTDGTIKSKLISKGEVFVDSGRITNGLKLPLPKGVRRQQVDTGQVQLHAQLTPRLDATAGPGPGWVPIPIECKLDNEGRVSCRIKWVDLSDPANNQLEVLSDSDYIVVAAAGETKTGA